MLQLNNHIFTEFSLYLPYSFLISLFTCKSQLCIIRRIYRFLPVFIETFSQTFVVKARSTVTCRGPYYFPFIIIGFVIFNSFYGVTRPCTFTRYTLVIFAIGFYNKFLSFTSLVKSRRPSELKSSLPTDIICPNNLN